MDDQRKPTDGSPTQTGKDDAPLGPSNAIGRRLRAYYEDVAAEPVPDRFLSLLDALDAAEKKSKTSGTGE